MTAASAEATRPVAARSVAADVIALTKLPITLTVTLTTAAGYALAGGPVTVDLALACLGTLLTAASSSTINHLQERHLDARMARTSDRPLPSGRWSPAMAGLLAVVTAGAGFALLTSIATRPLAAAALAALAMAWYNGAYTYLKRVTAFAAVPGAAIGAIPPLIGWVSAGGSLAHPLAWLLAGTLFVWQVPHFWLIVLRHGEDYAQAGLPSLTERLPRPQLARLTFAWLAAVALLAPSLAVVGNLGLPTLLALSASSAALVLRSVALLAPETPDTAVRNAFLAINLFALALTALLVTAGLAG